MSKEKKPLKISDIGGVKTYKSLNEALKDVRAQLVKQHGQVIAKQRRPGGR